MLTTKDIENANDLSSLEEMVSKCQRCSLYSSKKSDVFGVGNPKAEILFIGEAPGREEDLQGEPFVGAAGKFLTEMIKGIGLQRKDVYIANVLKHRPPNNRDPLPEEIEACWPFLRKQIEVIEPLLIVFLGRHSLNRFFPSLKISTVHGKAFKKEWNGKEQVFLALYHPAAALYNGSMRDILISDFKKIPKLLEKIKSSKKKLKQEKLI